MEHWSNLVGNSILCWEGEFIKHIAVFLYFVTYSSIPEGCGVISANEESVRLLAATNDETQA